MRHSHYWRCKTKYWWRSVDAHIEDVVGRMCMSVLHIKAANKWKIHHRPQMSISVNAISNKPSFRLIHQGVSDGPDSTYRTSYPVRENQTWPVVEVTSRVAYIPCGGYHALPLILRHVPLYITLNTPASRILYIASGMLWLIRTIQTTRTLHSPQGSTYVLAPNPMPSAVYGFHQRNTTLWHEDLVTDYNTVFTLHT
jgi:hypothetical protein